MKVLFLDGNNLFYKAWVSDPSLNENGEHIGGVRGTLNILQSLIYRLEPDRINIFWDSAGGSKRRKDLYKDYKEGRSISVKALNRHENCQLDREDEVENRYCQFIRTIEYLNNMPIKQFKQSDIEADDLLAYVIDLDKYEDDKKIIVSNDRDFIQLIRDDIKLYRHTEKEMMTKEDVLDKYDIHPNNFAMARAVAGDESDNIDGIYLVGLKTVADRFPFVSSSARQSISDVIEKSELLKEDLKTMQNVHEGEDKIRRNYKLMQLYEPQISPDAKRDLRETAENDNGFVFNRIKVAKMMKEDNIYDHNWSTLMSFMRQVILTSK